MIKKSLPSRRKSPFVGASILAADFANLERDCSKVINAGADYLHLDVMDGHFVPNLTMGPALIKSLRKCFADIYLDAHLMVAHPLDMINSFVESGVDHITFHIESEDSIESVINECQKHQVGVGLALNPKTKVDHVKKWLEDIDLLLFMSVQPGFAGQAFKPEVLDKVNSLKDIRPRELRFQIDGGVNEETAPQCINAGIDFLVAANAIFLQSDYESAINGLRGN